MKSGVTKSGYSAGMPSRLYVVRHGKAEQDSASGRDADRELTDRGHAQAAWLGQCLQEIASARGARLLVSPIRRARQTAEAIEAALEIEAVVEARLATDRRVSDVLLAVQEVLPDDTRSLVIVGHNPHFEAFVGVMLGRGPLSMRTGEMIGLAFDRAIEPGGATSFGVWRLDDD